MNETADTDPTRLLTVAVEVLRHRINGTSGNAGATGRDLGWFEADTDLHAAIAGTYLGNDAIGDACWIELASPELGWVLAEWLAAEATSSAPNVFAVQAAGVIVRHAPWAWDGIEAQR